MRVCAAAAGATGDSRASVVPPHTPGDAANRVLLPRALVPGATAAGGTTAGGSGIAGCAPSPGKPDRQRPGLAGAEGRSSRSARLVDLRVVYYAVCATYCPANGARLTGQ